MQAVKFTTKNLCILTLMDQFFTLLSRIPSAIISALLIFIQPCTRCTDEESKLMRQNTVTKNQKEDFYWEILMSKLNILMSCSYNEIKAADLVSLNEKKQSRKENSCLCVVAHLNKKNSVDALIK